MLYSMIDKIRADLVKPTKENIWPGETLPHHLILVIGKLELIQRETTEVLSNQEIGQRKCDHEEGWQLSDPLDWY